MRLHRLTLRDVKGVTERTVEFPDHGVVVVEGPNEIGKSTMLEAFDRLLDPRAKATSAARAVRALQPVGRDVGPFVEAELTVGPYRLVVAKRWLREPMTSVRILTPVPEQLSGSAAQARLDALLEGELDRPLWEALRVVQAAELGQVELTDSGVLTEALDGASGADLHAAEGASLLDRVDAEFARYWTPTGRVTGELREAVQAWQHRRDAAVLAHGRLQETEQLVQRHQGLLARQDELAAARPALMGSVETASQQAREVAELEEAYTLARRDHDQAQERSVQAARDQRARASLVGEEARAGEEAQRAAERAEAAEVLAVAAERALEPVAEQVRTGEAALGSAEAVFRRAAADLDLLAARAREEELAARADRVAEVLAELETAQQEVSGPGLDDAGLADLQHRHDALALERARHEASSPTVVVESLGADVTVTSEGVAASATSEGTTPEGSEGTTPAGSEGTTSGLTAGERHEQPVTATVSVEVAGAVRVRIEPHEGSRRRAERIESLAGDYAAALAAAGVADLEEARAQHRASVTRAERLGALRRSVADLAGPRGTGGLLADLDEVRRLVAESEAGREGVDAPWPGDVGTARALVRAALTEVDRLRAQAVQVRAGYDAAAREASTRRADAQRTATALEVAIAAHRRLTEDLRTARAEVDDDTLAARLAEVTRVFATVEAAEARARRTLEECDADGVRRRAEQAVARLEEHDDVATRVRDELLVLQGHVEQTSGEGRAEVYETALVELDRERAALESVDRRARAVRQLRTTLREHRDAAHRAYVRPYADQLERLGRVVYGATFGVELADDLTITARHLEGTTVPFDQLSGGAKEQLGILARLAVAALVDPDDGVPVVIDDALGYTDPQRLRQVGAAFAGPAERVQVILLTCTPERYAQIPSATTVRLTA